MCVCVRVRVCWHAPTRLSSWLSPVFINPLKRLRVLRSIAASPKDPLGLASLFDGMKRTAMKGTRRRMERDGSTSSMDEPR